jgi:hypothetical protein
MNFQLCEHARKSAHELQPDGEIIACNIKSVHSIFTTHNRFASATSNVQKWPHTTLLSPSIAGIRAQAVKQANQTITAHFQQ